MTLKGLFHRGQVKRALNKRCREVGVGHSPDIYLPFKTMSSLRTYLNPNKAYLTFIDATNEGWRRMRHNALRSGDWASSLTQNRCVFWLFNSAGAV
jgi:hypothetical protein